MAKTDIKTLAHIHLLVDRFYEQVQRDTLVGGIFHGIIRDWPVHLEKMYRFWQTVLLEEHTYNGSPFPPHAQMPLQQQHFDRWLLLWENTINALFTGEKAEEAKWRGRKMATLFLSKIEYFRRNNTTPLV